VDDKIVQDYKISEKDFLVVMVSKPKASPKVAETVAEPTEPTEPVIAATPEPVAAAVPEVAPVAATTTTENTDSQLGK
jgi:UV excision repair protein RAD23